MREEFEKWYESQPGGTLGGIVGLWKAWQAGRDHPNKHPLPDYRETRGILKPYLEDKPTKHPDTPRTENATGAHATQNRE